MDVFLTGILVLFGLLCTALLRKHLHEAKLLRFREMQHKERMKALERDCPLPNDEPDILNELLGHNSNSSAYSADDRAAGAGLICVGALCLGLTALLGGVGLTLGLYFQADPDVAGLWGIGLVPTFVGIGLLMFVRLSKSFDQNARPDRDSA
jgi:hypothetical protein